MEEESVPSQTVVLVSPVVVTVFLCVFFYFFLFCQIS